MENLTFTLDPKVSGEEARATVAGGSFIAKAVLEQRQLDAIKADQDVGREKEPVDAQNPPNQQVSGGVPQNPPAGFVHGAVGPTGKPSRNARRRAARAVAELEAADERQPPLLAVVGHQAAPLPAIAVPAAHPHPRPAGRGRGGPGRGAGGPMPPILPQQQPHQPAQPRQVPGPAVPWTVQNRYKAYAEYVDFNDSTHKQYVQALRERGIPVRNKIDRHPGGAHPVSAAVRRFATVSAMYRLYSDFGCRKICSVFGSPRDAELARQLNKGVSKDHAFEMTVYNPEITVKDLGRKHGSDVVTAVNFNDFDGFLMVDVYAMPDGPLTPSSFAPLTGKGQPVIWIGHEFVGAFGTIESEGAWIRVMTGGQEGIRASPDQKGEQYGPHPTCDWLHSSGVHPHGGRWIGWTQDRSPVGDTVRVLISSAAHPLKAEGSSRRERRHVWVDLPELLALRDWHGYVVPYLPRWVTRTLIPHRRALVSLPIKDTLKGHLAASKYSAYSWRSLVTASVNQFAADRDYNLTKTIFPELMPELVQTTALAAFVEGCDQKARSVAAMNSLYGPEMSTYNAQVDVIGEAAPRRGWMFYAAVILLFGGASFWLWLKFRKMSAGGLGVVQLASVAERVVPEATTLYERLRRKAHSVVDRTLNCVGAWVNQPWHSATEVVRSWTDSHRPDWPTVTALAASILGNAALEEAIKRVHPWAPLIFALFEAILKFAVHDSASTPVGIVIVSSGVLCHLLCAQLPFLQGTAIHAVWNYCWLYVQSAPFRKAHGFNSVSACVQQTPIALAMLSAFLVSKKNERWENFRATYYDDPQGTSAEMYLADVLSEPFDAKRGIVPKARVPRYDLKYPEDKQMVVVGHKGTDIELHSPVNVYWFLPTSAPGWSPAPTDAMIWGSVESRILPEPPLAVLLQAEAWLNIPSYVTGLTWGPADFDGNRAEWLNHFVGSKKHRARKAAEHLDAYGLKVTDHEVTENTVRLKSDELLYQRDGAGLPMLKPRAIIDVSTVLQARAGPEIVDLTRRLHLVWGWPSQCDPFPVWTCERDGFTTACFVTWASDATDDLLTRWYDLADQLSGYDCKISVLVAGDDLLVHIVHRSMKARQIEGDASVWDQSQSVGPLLYEMRGMAQLGASEELRQLLYANFAATYVVRYRKDGRKAKIRHFHRPMRTTGGAETSWGNSYNMGGVSAQVLYELVQADALMSANEMVISKLYLKYGVRMKLKFPHGIENATFLKGTWYPCESTFRVAQRLNSFTDRVWGPLPSRFLKMGKSLTDPRVTYRTKDYEQALRWHMGDIAVAYSGFIQVPLVRAFVDRYSQYASGRDVSVFADHQVTPTHRHRHATITSMQPVIERYGLPLEDWLSMESQIGLSNPCTFLSHPGYETLARVDYG